MIKIEIIFQANEIEREKVCHLEINVLITSLDRGSGNELELQGVKCFVVTVISFQNLIEGNVLRRMFSSRKKRTQSEIQKDFFLLKRQFQFKFVILWQF